MKAIKKWGCILMLCMSLLVTFPVVRADAAEASTTVEIGFWVQPATSIEKGDSVQTGDSANLHQYFVLLSLSTLSLFCLLFLYKKREKEETN